VSNQTSGTPAGYAREMSTPHLKVTRNVFEHMRSAFMFGRGEAHVDDRCASKANKRRMEVQALAGLTTGETRIIQDAVGSAATRMEIANIAGEQLASRTSAFSVPFTAMTVAILSVYALPQVRPYGGLDSVLVLLAALLATVVGSVMYLFSLPTIPRNVKIGSILDVLDDWLLFLFVSWIYISIATAAWKSMRSPTRQSWTWEVLFAGSIIPFAAVLSIALTAVTIGLLDMRRESRQNHYSINDFLILALLELATDAQGIVDRWYEPKSRRFMVQRLESAARSLEIGFSRAAQGIHGTGAAEPMREHGRRIAAALRRLEQYVALAAGPSHITKVRDGLCSGLLAAAQGDWASLSGTDPGSAVNSFFRRLWPRLLRLLFFGGATVGLLWLSQDENWRSAAIPAAIAMGVSAVLAIVSPAEDVTKRAQEVFDRTFGPLWHP
jgi:hypothetical protein